MYQALMGVEIFNFLPYHLKVECLRAEIGLL